MPDRKHPERYGPIPDGPGSGEIDLGSSDFGPNYHREQPDQFQKGVSL